MRQSFISRPYSYTEFNISKNVYSIHGRGEIGYKWKTITYHFYVEYPTSRQRTSRESLDICIILHTDISVIYRYPYLSTNVMERY